MAVGTRARLVSSQGGEEHVSSVVLGPDEAFAQLQAEADLHEMAGWSVVRLPEGIVCIRRGSTRRVWLRTAGPMDDLL